MLEQNKSSITSILKLQTIIINRYIYNFYSGAYYPVTAWPEHSQKFVARRDASLVCTPLVPSGFGVYLSNCSMGMSSSRAV